MHDKISEETLKRAISLRRAAVKAGLSEPTAIVSDNHGDSITYIFANKTSMVIVCCSPSCYLVSHGSKKSMTMSGAEYLIIKSVPQFMRKLKSLGFKTLTKPQLRKLENDIKKLKAEREPDDEELEDIEEDGEQ